MDAGVLEREKENIKPLVHGRSATKLGKALHEKLTPNKLLKERERLEIELLSDELDDPLQAYTDYISWIHENYPQGANKESGLLQLLERCTSCFRDTAHYKNDPRYLKVWLEYAEFSDSPRDIFVYLAKKNIGQELALYYEQFAAFLESKSSISHAQEVYDIGIERSARPLKRLQRSKKHFEERNMSQNISESTSIRESLIASKPLASAVWSDSAQPVKKQKLAIHKDESLATLKETVFTQSSSARLNSTSFTTKENRIAAKPWAGEILKQSGEPTDADKVAKFEVFRDDSREPTKNFHIRVENQQTYTIVCQPGKPREKICLNVELLNPFTEEELCLGELLALFSKPEQSQKVETLESAQQPQYSEREQTFTIPLRDDDTVHRPISPTITMMSRVVTNEVLDMFNAAARDMNSDDDGKEYEESTNYDGFCTETINVASNNFDNLSALNATTPPTDQYDSDGSSPFLNHGETDHVKF